jgi:hypothetical protein
MYWLAKYLWPSKEDHPLEEIISVIEFEVKF